MINYKLIWKGLLFMNIYIGLDSKCKTLSITPSFKVEERGSGGEVIKNPLTKWHWGSGGVSFEMKIYISN